MILYHFFLNRTFQYKNKISFESYSLIFILQSKTEILLYLLVLYKLLAQDLHVEDKVLLEKEHTGIANYLEQSNLFYSSILLSKLKG